MIYPTNPKATTKITKQKVTANKPAQKAKQNHKRHSIQKKAEEHEKACKEQVGWIENKKRGCRFKPHDITTVISFLQGSKLRPRDAKELVQFQSQEGVGSAFSSACGACAHNCTRNVAWGPKDPGSFCTSGFHCLPDSPIDVDTELDGATEMSCSTPSFYSWGNCGPER